MIAYTSDLQHSMYMHFLVSNFGQQGASNDNGGLTLFWHSEQRRYSAVQYLQYNLGY